MRIKEDGVDHITQGWMGLEWINHVIDAKIDIGPYGAMITRRGGWVFGCEA